MTPITITSEQTEAVRHQAITIIDQLTKKAKSFELPDPPETLALYRNKLEDNHYKVLVVGEAKRGKSSFINALIGRDILPTNVDIATSQVFQVSQAEKEAYRLRFEDNSQQEITAADLPRYGSQVLVDTEGKPQLNQLIRWIEVDVPVRFLPQGVSILDTPGMGSLYAAHSQITQRFVPYADAVVYVLDSTQPIGQSDLEFIETLLGVTRNLLFIQTKIDQFRKENWQELQLRNEQILSEYFHDRLADLRVWPISSINLMKAGQTGDEDYLMVSRHKELAAALQAFLFRVAGWNRSAEAMIVADHFHFTDKQILAGREKALTEESQQKRVELQQAAMQRKQLFESEWGEHGHKRLETIQSLQKLAIQGKQAFQQALQDIERDMRTKIDALESFSEAEKFGEALSGQVAATATGRWRKICEKAEALCISHLQPLIDSAAQMNLALESDGLIGKPESHHFVLETECSRYDKLKSAVFEGTSSTLIVGAGVDFLTTLVATSTIFPPATPVVLFGVGVATVIWRVCKGWTGVGKKQLEAAKQELCKHLATVMYDIRSQFLQTKDFGYISPVEQYFDLLLSTTKERINSFAKQKYEEAFAESKRLIEQANLDEQQRAAETRLVKQQVLEWEGIAADIRKLFTQLEQLNQAIV
jgi:GTP-binding protein EngB required for normal cell division